MTPTEIKKTLEEIGGRANKRLGQHFLIDRAALRTIVDSASIHAGDTVLEIGPGLGVLTEALLDAGANVIAIERDVRFVSHLENRFRDRDFHLVKGDASIVHWHELVEGRPWKFVSNLPYSITSLALRKALWSPEPPENLVVLVQREVAERAVAKDGKTSLLSLMVALACDGSRIVKRVPAGAFFPPPKVESAILQITPSMWPDREKRWGIDPEKIMEVAKRGFAHPRKKLASNLGEAGSLKLEAGGIPANARAEDLSPEDWARLARTAVFGDK